MFWMAMQYRLLVEFGFLDTLFEQVLHSTLGRVGNHGLIRVIM